MGQKARQIEPELHDYFVLLFHLTYKLVKLYQLAQKSTLPHVRVSQVKLSAR